MAKARILTIDLQTKEKGSTTAHVVWGQNRLLQRRQFAWEGRDWLYQPSLRSPFQKVSASEVPDSVVQLMAAETGKPVEVLRGGS